MLSSVLLILLESGSCFIMFVIDWLSNFLRSENKLIKKEMGGLFLRFLCLVSKLKNLVWIKDIWMILRGFLLFKLVKFNKVMNFLIFILFM